MAYEFSDDDGNKMLQFSRVIVVFGTVILLNGAAQMIRYFASLGSTDELSTYYALASSVEIIIGVLFMRPSDNFENIATTEGQDIEELLQGLKEYDLNLWVIMSLIGFIVILTLYDYLGVS